MIADWSTSCFIAKATVDLSSKAMATIHFRTPSRVATIRWLAKASLLWCKDISSDGRSTAGTNLLYTCSRCKKLVVVVIIKGIFICIDVTCNLDFWCCTLYEIYVQMDFSRSTVLGASTYLSLLLSYVMKWIVTCFILSIKDFLATCGCYE